MFHFIGEKVAVFKFWWHKRERMGNGLPYTLHQSDWWPCRKRRFATGPHEWTGQLHIHCLLINSYLVYFKDIKIIVYLKNLKKYSSIIMKFSISKYMKYDTKSMLRDYKQICFKIGNNLPNFCLFFKIQNVYPLCINWVHQIW